MEIQDKSKGDFISKSIIILQTSWFVMQCIARGAQGLPITELELVTIAFAGLNFVIYLLWWDKPLNVQCGVRVYKKRITDEPVDDRHILATAGFWVALGDALSKLPAAIVNGPLKDIIKLPWPARVLAWPIVKPFQIILGEPDERVGRRISTFYPHEWDEDRDHILLFILMIIPGVASAFGGIHCIGWSFTFPSTTEKTLWHIASISITGIPTLAILSSVLAPLFNFLFALLFNFLAFRGLGGLDRLLSRFFNHPVFVWISMFHLALLLFLYVLSRLVLLIIPFLTLRSPPPGTYHAVHWTSFIPHI